MFDLPLSDASMSEVLARVSFAYIRMRYEQTGFVGSGPPFILQRIYDELMDNDLFSIAFWVAIYKRQWRANVSLTQIRENCILAARQGQSWRRVAYPQYKSHRRDPRVTNRGVARDDTTGEK
jgi:Ni,Fe-hydrogenase I cytochrome b subunit